MLVLAWCLGGCAPVAASPEARLLVKPRSDISLSQFDQLLLKHGARRVGIIEKIGVHIVELSPESDARSVAASIGANPRIEFAEIDQRVPPSNWPNP